MTSPSPTDTIRGDLVWGVLGSFVDYVRAVEGQVTLIAPATATADGRFRFPLTRNADGVARFGGGVRFVAHGGALTLELEEPWVATAEGAEPATLSVRGTRATNTEGARLAFADIDSDNGTMLTEVATVAFDFRYPAGTALAPVEFVTGTL